MGRKPSGSQGVRWSKYAAAVCMLVLFVLVVGFVSVTLHSEATISNSNGSDGRQARFPTLRSPVPAQLPAKGAPADAQDASSSNARAAALRSAAAVEAALRDEISKLRSMLEAAQLAASSPADHANPQPNLMSRHPVEGVREKHGGGGGHAAHVGPPVTADALPELPGTLPPLLAAFRSGRLDWHDVVNPKTPPANPGLVALVQAEHATVELLQGYGAAYTGGRGAWEKHLACPLLRDPCMMHASVRECAEDDLCGWCAPRGLCLDVRKVWRDVPVRGRADPVCPQGLLVSHEAHETLLAGAGAAAQHERRLANSISVLALGTPSVPKVFDLTKPQGGTGCDVVVHRYRQSQHSYAGNTVMSYHFLYEYWTGKFPGMLHGPDAQLHDPRVHVWYPAGAATHFWEFLVASTDACHRHLGTRSARGVCYRATPLPMDAPLRLKALPPPSQLSATWGLQVPFGGEGDWADSAVGSPLAPAALSTAGAANELLETPAVAATLGQLPRDTVVSGISPEAAFVRIMGLHELHKSLERPVLTLISRRNKRVILNEHELVEAAQALGMEVQLVALERMPLYDQMRALRRTTVLVGIHGSGLTNGMFLPKGAAMIQLMPHGVYRGGSFFSKPAASAGAQYMEWTNPDASASAFHWEFMGEDMQGKVGSMLKRGDACCGDGTFFSFWINQDTRVPVGEWRGLLERALQSPLNAALRTGAAAAE